MLCMHVDSGINTHTISFSENALQYKLKNLKAGPDVALTMCRTFSLYVNNVTH